MERRKGPDIVGGWEIAHEAERDEGRGMREEGGSIRLDGAWSTPYLRASGWTVLIVQYQRCMYVCTCMSNHLTSDEGDMKCWPISPAPESMAIPPAGTKSSSSFGLGPHGGEGGRGRKRPSFEGGDLCFSNALINSPSPEIGSKLNAMAECRYAEPERAAVLPPLHSFSLILNI